MCRIGSGFRQVDSIALFRQRRSNFCAVLLRQVESPRDPWLAGFRNGVQSRVDALGRQPSADQRMTGFEMKNRIPPNVKWCSQAKNKAGKEIIYFSRRYPTAILILYSAPRRIGLRTK